MHLRLVAAERQEAKTCMPSLVAGVIHRRFGIRQPCCEWLTQAGTHLSDCI